MNASVRSKSNWQIVSYPMRRIALGALLALSLIPSALAGEGKPTIGSTDVFAPFPVIPPEEMAHLRGGFKVAGLELEFGASVRTVIDDVVRLETIVHFTKNGLVSSTRNLTQTIANAAGARGVQAGTMSIRYLGSGGTQLDFSGLGERISGVVLSDAQGLTAAIYNVTDGQIITTVINQASHRHIHVEMNLRINVKNFSEYSASLHNMLLNQHIAQQNRIF